MRSTPARCAARHHRAGALDIGSHDVLRIARPQPVVGGDVKQITDAGHGARDRICVGAYRPRRSPAGDRRDSIRELVGRTSARTAWPACSRHLATAEPTKPLAPVTRIMTAPFWRIHNRYALIREHTILPGMDAMASFTPIVCRRDHLRHGLLGSGTSNRPVGARSKRQAAGPNRVAGPGRFAARTCRHLFARHGHAYRQAQPAGL